MLKCLASGSRQACGPVYVLPGLRNDNDTIHPRVWRARIRCRASVTATPGGFYGDETARPVPQARIDVNSPLLTWSDLCDMREQAPFSFLVIAFVRPHSSHAHLQYDELALTGLLGGGRALGHALYRVASTTFRGGGLRVYWCCSRRAHSIPRKPQAESPPGIHL